eukprot:TRINITY_DN99102_c0_g1_i1.p1 TRINITY_DN99102_c0_g1~~TRINITY_DN99102_c0_g1_i1.p1  ORF type:complete len:79 (-),score=12.69 TRINITY_DN99102_c0_g1_i1:51-287(-)
MAYVLSQEEKDDFLEECKNYPNCPECNSNENVRMNVIGRPSGKLIALFEAFPNKIASGGCNGGNAQLTCTCCNKDFNP